jgi:hypothetical protein
LWESALRPVNAGFSESNSISRMGRRVCADPSGDVMGYAEANLAGFRIRDSLVLRMFLEISSLWNCWRTVAKCSQVIDTVSVLQRSLREGATCWIARWWDLLGKAHELQ